MSSSSLPSLTPSAVSAVSAVSNKVSVPASHICLILLRHKKSTFYLEIPLGIIGSLCLKPRKYLLYLGWCILGVEGKLALKLDGDEIDTDGDLDEQEKYYYVPNTDDLTRAVDPEVMKTRTSVASGTTETRDAFRIKWLNRDVGCVWTGASVTNGVGMHIIPFNRGSEWFQLIVQSRTSYDEDVTDLDDINDVRNGFLGNFAIHEEFDSRRVAVLRTPNRILDTQDIPQHDNPRLLPQGLSYPTGSRYSIQRLVPMEKAQLVIPSNGDAAFKTDTEDPKPSELLLHYHYGIVAVNCWGRGVEVLQSRATPPRPHVPVPAPMAPPKTTNDRTIAIRKRMAAQNKGGDGGNSVAAAGSGGLVESEGEAEWDADDVMLFFLLNTPAAKERHRKKVEEDTQRMERWRQGVAQGSE